MRDGRGGPMVWQIGPAVCRHELMLATRKPEDGGTMPGKRCDDDTTGAERNGALGGDGDGLATDEGQPGGRVRKTTGGGGQAAGEEDSSAPSWQSVS